MRHLRLEKNPNTMQADKSEYKIIQAVCKEGKNTG